MRRILLIICFLCSGHNSQAQTPQQFEATISALLENRTGYQNIEKIVLLIEWESTIIYNIPCISPVLPPDFRTISVSSPYGDRYHPILHEYRHHSGIDLPAHTGDSVYASANGLVLGTGFDTLLGNYIRIRHGFGFISTYGHLSSIQIQANDSVSIGQYIGRVGSSGRSTGPHLHYALKKNGKEEDAYPYCFLLIKTLLQSQRKEQ